MSHNIILMCNYVFSSFVFSVSPGTKGVGSLGGFFSFLKYWYLQWELNTSLYMLEPEEKAIISILYSPPPPKTCSGLSITIKSLDQ